MSLDLTLLRLLKSREKYQKLARAVPPRAVDPHTQTILSDFGRYFREHADCQQIEPAAFMLWFKLIHPKLKDEAVSVIGAVVEKLAEPAPPGSEQGIMERLVAADAASKATDLLTKWNDGEEVDLYASLRALTDKFELDIARKVKTTQVLDPIEDLLLAEENDVGLHWRLPCLNRHIKPLQGGDFVVVAARPDKGKTTFCASELTFMAAQVDALFPNEKRSILWLNNEGPGRKIVMRNFQAAGGWTVEQMVKLAKDPSTDARYRHALQQQYAEHLGGRPGVLRVFDVHGMWNYEVEDLIDQYNPALVVFDMIDNIKFGGDLANGGMRTDQVLEGMYQWARLLGVKYDTAVIANSQLPGDADGLQWPTLGQLKDSRTGKQGAADVIITIGAVNDPTLSNSRYIGTTKNKKVRTGVGASPMKEVQFMGDIARYVEQQ